MDQTLRRVAVIGGVRIPFCRSNTLYADKSNLEMLTAVLNGLVDKYNLTGVHIDEAIGGAVVIALQGLEPGARGGARHQAGADHARHHHPAGVRHQPAGGVDDPGQDRHRRDRVRHRHGLRHHLGRADRVQAEVRAPPGRGAERQVDGAAAHGLQGLLAGRAGAAAAHRRRAAHGPLHGPARRADGAGVEDHPRRAGPAGLREPQEGGGGLPLGLHGRPDRAVRRRVPRQQPARGHQPGEDRHAQDRVRQVRARHAHGRQLHAAHRRRRRRAAGVGGVGGQARPAGAGLSHLFADVGQQLRRRRGAADGADDRGVAHAASAPSSSCRTSTSTRSTRRSPRRCWPR